MTEDRYEKLARELARCQADLDHAIDHMTAYIRLLDRDAPSEAFLIGRMLGHLQALARTYDDLDNVIDHGEESP